MKSFLISAVALTFASAVFFSCRNNESAPSQDGKGYIDTEAVEPKEDPALFDEDIPVEEGQDVWTSFGGTYFFWGDNGSVVVEFPLPQEGGCVKFYYKDGEYEATADETTGKIVAKDSLGHVAFKGYLYDGGNTIKGLFYGKPLEAAGSGD